MRSYAAIQLAAYASSHAFVSHGVPCPQPMSNQSLALTSLWMTKSASRPWPESPPHSLGD